MDKVICIGHFAPNKTPQKSVNRIYDSSYLYMCGFRRRVKKKENIVIILRATSKDFSSNPCLFTRRSLFGSVVCIMLKMVVLLSGLKIVLEGPTVVVPESKENPQLFALYAGQNRR